MSQHETDLLGTEWANDEPSEDYEDRRKRCYELSAYALCFGDAPKKSILVHGTIDGGPGTLGRIGHAWLELPDGRVWEPIMAEFWEADRWHSFANTREERRYTRKEAARMIVVHQHYGRWHESQYR